MRHASDGGDSIQSGNVGYGRGGARGGVTAQWRLTALFKKRYPSLYKDYLAQKKEPTSSGVFQGPAVQDDFANVLALAGLESFGTAWDVAQSGPDALEARLKEFGN